MQDVERWIGGRFVAMPLRRFVTMPFCRYAARCAPFGPRTCARIAQLKRVVLCTGRLAAARAPRATEDVRVRSPPARTRAATRGRSHQRLSRRRGWRCLSPGSSRCRCDVRRDERRRGNVGTSGIGTSIGAARALRACACACPHAAHVHMCTMDVAHVHEVNNASVPYNATPLLLAQHQSDQPDNVE